MKYEYDDAGQREGGLMLKSGDDEGGIDDDDDGDDEVGGGREVPLASRVAPVFVTSISSSTSFLLNKKAGQVSQPTFNSVGEPSSQGSPNSLPPLAVVHPVIMIMITDQ